MTFFCKSSWAELLDKVVVIIKSNKTYQGNTFRYKRELFSLVRVFGKQMNPLIAP